MCEGKDGWQIGGASTNLTLHSSDFSHADWLLAGANPITLTQDGTLSPNRIEQAWKIEKTVSGDNRVQQNSVSVFGEIKTTSWFVKRGDVDLIKITSGDSLSLQKDIFDFSTGTFTTTETDSQSVEKLADGWYRISQTVTTGCSGTFVIQLQTDTTVLGYLYGAMAQSELLAFASSYIPTIGSAQTRAASLISIYGSNLPDLTKPFSISIELPSIQKPIKDFTKIVSGDDPNEFHMQWANSGGTLYLKLGSTTGTHLIATYITIQPKRIDVVFDGTNIISYLDGVFERTVLFNVGPVVQPSRLHIGSQDGGTNHMDATVRRLEFRDFPLNADEIRLLAGE